MSRQVPPHVRGAARRRLSWLAAAALLGWAGAMAQPAPDAQQLLAASDLVRNPAQSFVLTAQLTEYRAGKQVDANTLAIYSRPDSPGGAFRTLVRFVAPARDAGKLMLKNGADLWFHDPGNKATIRISADQRLLGQAANGDVATANFAHDYRARLLGEEQVTDGERQPRQAHRLELVAAAAGLTYHRIELWIDARNQQPIRARFYSETDRLLKTAFYRRFQQELGARRPTETVIIDGLDPGWVTVMRFSEYAWRDIPEAWLQRDNLARFRAE